MNQSFGDRLLQFANSVDILEEQTYNKICKVIENYTEKTLEIKNVQIMVEAKIGENEVALKQYELQPTPNEVIIKIRDKGGEYAGQTSCAFDQKSPLWIVSKNDKTSLIKSDDYQDLWSEVKEIPKYYNIGTDDPIKTSIIIPLRLQRSRELVFGVINFETEEYLEITEQAKCELSKIAETVSILLQLQWSRGSQKNNTITVIDMLEKSLQEESIPKLTKPRIFLASSEKAQIDVIGVVRKVMSEYSDKMDVVYWKDMDNPGNINKQLLEAISSSRYGICYFSEIMDESFQTDDIKYRDNSNVLFEAGMMHGKTDDVSDTPISWIPIREEMSLKAPFDFASERMIGVPRLPNGVLNKEEFEEKFKNRIDSMLSSTTYN